MGTKWGVLERNNLIERTWPTTVPFASVDAGSDKFQMGLGGDRESERQREKTRDREEEGRTGSGQSSTYRVMYWEEDVFLTD